MEINNLINSNKSVGRFITVVSWPSAVQLEQYLHALLRRKTTVIVYVCLVAFLERRKFSNDLFHASIVHPGWKVVTDGGVPILREWDKRNFVELVQIGEAIGE